MMINSTGVNLIERMDQLEVPHGCLAVWALGQMGFAVKGQGRDLVYFDPYLSNSVPERFPSMVEKMARSFPPDPYSDLPCGSEQIQLSAAFSTYVEYDIRSKRWKAAPV
jgi:hypothetical protein